MSANNIALLFLCTFVWITDSYHLKVYIILFGLAAGDRDGTSFSFFTVHLSMTSFKFWA